MKRSIKVIIIGIIIAVAIIINIGIGVISLSITSMGCATVVPSTMTDTTLSFYIRDIGCGHITSMFSWDSPITNIRTGFDAAEVCQPSKAKCLEWGGSNPYVDEPEYRCDCYIGSVPQRDVKSSTFVIRYSGKTIPAENIRAEGGVFVFDVPAISTTSITSSEYWANKQVSVSGGITLTSEVLPTGELEFKFVGGVLTSILSILAIVGVILL